MAFNLLNRVQGNAHHDEQRGASKLEGHPEGVVPQTSHVTCVPKAERGQLGMYTTAPGTGSTPFGA